MEDAGATRRIAHFGPFEAHLASGLLTRKGIRVRIGAQPFQVLALLLSRPGQIVTREEIRLELWPNGTYVDFEGSLNSALKKLRAALDDDPKDSRFIETIPKRGYRFIMPVRLAIASSGNGKKALGQPHWLASRSPAAPQRRILGKHGLWLRWKFVGMGSFALIVAIVASMILLDRTTSTLPSAEIPAHPIVPRTSIAVLGFRNVSGGAGHDWIAAALSEMLDTELAGAGKLRLVPGEDVANLRRSSPWPENDSLDPKTTSRVGNALDSDFLVLGSYTAIGAPGHSQLRIDARLQDAKTGKILTETAAGGSEMSLFQIVSQLGAGLRKGLSVPAPNESDELGLMASMPLDPETARFYSLGLEKLRDFDSSAAKDLLVQATTSDPKFSLAHAMLAQAWGQLGFEKKRKAEIKMALQLSKDLTRPERLMVEGDYYDSLGNHEKAALVYGALFELYPDEVSYGLHLAEEQRLAGEGGQSVETLRRLRSLPLPASHDPRIDLEETWFAKSKTEELRLERSAMDKAVSQGKRLIYAEARKRECMTLNYTDHPEEATASCEEAYKIFLGAGNRLEAADCVRLMGDNQGYLGHEKAVATYERALSILKGLGEYEKTGAILNNMAIHFENEGQLARAELLYEQAESNFRQAGDKNNVITAHGNLGDVLFELGNLPGAGKAYGEAIQMAAAVEQESPGYLLYRLADLELTEGHVDEALVHAEAAVKAYPPERGGFQYLTSAMLELGDVLEAQGDLAGARQQYEQALAIRKKVGAVGLVAENQQSLAELDVLEGHAKPAEPLLQGAIAEFKREKADLDVIEAYTWLARALLVEGKLNEAKRAVGTALQLSRGSPYPALKLPAEIEQACVEIAEISARPAPKHNFSAPRNRLHDVIASARRLGYYTIECEARLALEELEMRLDPLSGRAHLSALSAQARRRGMESIAREAEAIEKTSSPPASPASDGLRASTARP